MSVTDRVPAAPGTTSWWAAWAARLERRKPRADGLTIERIVQEAVDLVDAEGLDALTVRGLAARFGTGPATLYRHIASRDELLVLLVDHVLGEIALPEPDLPARVQVETLATNLRGVLLRHPNLVPALPAAPLQGPNAVLGSERALTALVADGFPLAVAVGAYLALVDYILGSVFFDSARLDRYDAGAPAGAGEHPLLEAVEEHVGALGSERAFAFGLSTFLDGLASQHAIADR